MKFYNIYSSMQLINYQFVTFNFIKVNIIQSITCLHNYIINNINNNNHRKTLSDM